MVNKIFKDDNPTFRTIEDLKILNKFLTQRLKTIGTDKNNEPLNSSDVGEWFYNQSRCYVYDIDAMNELEIYDKVYSQDNPLPESELTDMQKEAIDKMPINVELNDEGLKIEVLTTLKKKEFNSLRMSHNIANEIETKLNYIKNKEGTLFGKVPQNYCLTITRYIQEGSTSYRICDPSNIEVSNIINAVCRKVGISDAYDSMKIFIVQNIEVKTRKEEKTVFEFKKIPL